MASDADRLSLTFSLALILHAMLILGVGFTFEIASPKKSMQIILVQEKSNAPKEHDFLAQADLEGGGEEEKKKRPTVPLPAPFASEKAALVATKEEEMPSHKARKGAAKVDKKRPHSALPPLAPPVREAKNRASEGQKIAKASKQSAALDDANTPAVSDNKTNSANHSKITPTNAVPIGIQSREVATLKAEIALKLEAIAKRPKRTFISASTKKSKYAHYMETWRIRVERIGNLNYPKAALAENISGSLVLDVSIRKNGTISAITIIKPSGHKILDETAEQVVRMAAPFPPFSEEIRQETDILHITRTWEFIDGYNRLY